MSAPPGVQAMPLAELAEAAGAGPTILEYLNARGIKTTPTLALIAHSRDDFIAQVVRPLIDGFQKGTTRIVVSEEERPIAQAVLEHMWQEATVQWQLCHCRWPQGRPPRQHLLEEELWHQPRLRSPPRACQLRYGKSRWRGLGKEVLAVPQELEDFL
eukprot:s2136_g14.t1